MNEKQATPVRKAFFWILGSVLIFSGVLVASRLPGSVFDPASSIDTALCSTISLLLLSLGGLFWIGSVRNG